MTKSEVFHEHKAGGTSIQTELDRGNEPYLIVRDYILFFLKKYHLRTFHTVLKK